MASAAHNIVLSLVVVMLVLLTYAVAYLFYMRMQTDVVHGVKRSLPAVLPPPVGRLVAVEVLPKLSKPLPHGHSAIVELQYWSGLDVVLPAADTGKIVGNTGGVLRLNVNGIPFVGQLDYELLQPSENANGFLRVKARQLCPVAAVLKDSGPFYIQVDLDKAYVGQSPLSTPTVDQKQRIEGYIPYEMRYSVRVVPDSEISEQ